MNSPRQPLTAIQAMNRAAALCARGEQAPADIRSKLIKWGLSASDASWVMDKLTEQGFVDDERFATAFIKDRFNFNGWGRIKIAYQLKLKGIPAPVIEQAMAAAIDDDEYIGRLTELLRAKWRSLNQREPRAAWAAMMRFAASRGFETAIASQCVKRVTALDDQDD